MNKLHIAILTVAAIISFDAHSMKRNNNGELPNPNLKRLSLVRKGIQMAPRNLFGEILTIDAIPEPRLTTFEFRQTIYIPTGIQGRHCSKAPTNNSL